jgi:hypothetical protein
MQQEAVKSKRQQPGLLSSIEPCFGSQWGDEAMSSEQVLERRAAQRFDLNLPVSARLVGSERVGCGFTQNVSARGALFHTDLPMVEADAVEISLAMPSEITLAESMRVRCRGKVLRVLPSAVGTGSVVAVQFEGYEFLPEAEGGSSTFARISALHEHPHVDQGSVEPKSSMRSFPRP